MRVRCNCCGRFVRMIVRDGLDPGRLESEGWSRPILCARCEEEQEEAWW